MLQRRQLLTRGDVTWLLFAMAHVPLALAMREARYVATAHAVLTLLLGLVFTLSRRRTDLPPAFAAAYIVGAEVLWRATGARVFWEYGKYAVTLILAVGILRRRTLSRGALAPLAYFALLVPSCAFWLGEPLAEARQEISFNLSGPLCLAVSAAFFAGTRLEWPSVRRLFLYTIAPVLGIATVALHAILTAGSIQFTTESNFTASGEFGPNQVSQALSLGILFCWLILLMEKDGNILRWVAAVLVPWFLAHALLTFSRGGVYLAAIGMLATAPHALRHSYLRKRLVLVAGMLALPLLVYVLPSLDALTGGKLSERYVDISGTNRELIARQQFDVFRRHPITGVGPGRSFEEVIGRAATHTEFTRLLSEHGMFGATALVVLLTALLKRYRQKRGEGAKTTVGACVLWGLAAMAGYATRLTATSFVLGLAFARFEERNATAHRPGGSNCVEERFGSLGLPCNATRA